MNINSAFSYLSAFIKFEVWLFLVGLSSLIFYLILKGKINLRGLFREKDKNKTHRWERSQLLILTIIFVLYYLFEVGANLSSGNLPGVPLELFLILGGSNFLYIFTKVNIFLKDRRGERV